MRGVQDPQLGLLVPADIGDHLDARPLPRGTARREHVLDDPLRPRFGQDGPVVGDAGIPQQRPVDVGRRGHHPVDHGRREGDVVPHPLGQARVPALGQVADDPRRGPAVAGQVVAGRDRERSGTRRAPADEALEQEPGQRARRVRTFKVVPHRGPVGSSGPPGPTAQYPCSVTVTCDDRDRRVGEPGPARLDLLGRDVDRRSSAPDRARVARRSLQEVVDEALRCEGFSAPLMIARPPDAPERPPGRGQCRQYAAWWARWNPQGPTARRSAAGALGRSRARPGVIAPSEGTMVLQARYDL